MNISLLDNDSTMSDEMDSLMLHSEVCNELEQSTEALLNSILRVDVVQLESEENCFSEEPTSSLSDLSSMQLNDSYSVKKARKCKSSFRKKMSEKNKGSRKCVCDLCTEDDILNNFADIQSNFTCNVCDDTFPQLSLLELHKREHGEQSYVCDVCNETFEEKHTLKFHQEHHHHQTVYPCNMCSATFATRRRLGSHKRIHVQERPFPCDFCGASFLRKSSLSAHLRAKPLVQQVHKQVPDLLCEACKLNFVSFCGKLRHFQQFHPDCELISEKACRKDDIKGKKTRKLPSNRVLVIGERTEETFNDNIAQEQQTLQDVEILFSLDVGEIININDDANESIQVETQHNMPEGFAAVTMSCIEEEEKDGEVEVVYEVVSESDLVLVCSCQEGACLIHEDQNHRTEVAAEFEEG